MEKLTDQPKTTENPEETSYGIVKSQKMNRTQTGIPGFDELVEGGFVKGSINLISGDAGTNKSIFSMQFIVNGILKYDEPGVYVSFEETKENVYAEMLVFGWDLQKLEESGKFIFLEYTPEQVDNVIRTGGGIVADVIQSINAKRLVIDSLTALTSLYESSIRRREELLKLFNLIRKWECTAVLIAENSQSLERHNTLEADYEVDSEIDIYTVRTIKKREKILEVYKMRATDHSTYMHKVIVGPKGLIIR